MCRLQGYPINFHYCVVRVYIVFHVVSEIHWSNGRIQPSARRVQREVQGQNHKTAQIQSVVGSLLGIVDSIFHYLSPSTSLSLPLYLPLSSLSFSLPLFLHRLSLTAGKRVTEDEVEEMLESDNPAVFTKDVSGHSTVCICTQVLIMWVACDCLHEWQLLLSKFVACHSSQDHIVLLLWVMAVHYAMDCNTIKTFSFHGLIVLNFCRKQ